MATRRKLKRNKGIGREQEIELSLLPEPRTKLAAKLIAARREIIRSGQLLPGRRDLMTDKQLRAIKQRTKRATQGPWRYDDRSGCIFACQDQFKVVEVCSHNTDSRRSANGEFIAATRTDITDLLAEIEWLRQRWDQVREADKMFIEIELEHRQRL